MINSEEHFSSILAFPLHFYVFSKIISNLTLFMSCDIMSLYWIAVWNWEKHGENPSQQSLSYSRIARQTMQVINVLDNENVCRRLHILCEAVLLRFSAPRKGFFIARTTLFQRSRYYEKDTGNGSCSAYFMFSC